MRSEQRIPKLRTRGRENRRRLLAEARRLLLERRGQPLRFSEVFEAAGVSRGSAYRIYIGIDDLLQDLASDWMNSFVDYLEASSPDVTPESWGDVSDYFVVRAAEYWADTADTMRVLPRVRSNAPSSYSAAVQALSECLAGMFDRYFAMPDIPDWMAKLSFYVQICDVAFSDAVRNKGRIGEQRQAEARALCRTYLEFHLPTWLPSR